MTESAATDLARADVLIGQALKEAPRSGPIHLVKGVVLSGHHRCNEAIPEFELALEADHNSVLALHALATCKLSTRSIEQVIPLEERAIRLSPRDPSIGWWYFTVGIVHLLQSRTNDAIVWLEKAHSALPEAPSFHSRLASAYALIGEMEPAAAELAEARRLNGALYSSLARLKSEYWGVPNIRALFEATYFAGLRKAGMPEE